MCDAAAVDAVAATVADATAGAAATVAASAATAAVSVAAATATAARHQSSIQPPPQQLLTLLQLEQAMCGMQWAPEANGVTALCCGNAGQLQAICRNIPQHLMHLGPACNTM